MEAVLVRDIQEGKDFIEHRHQESAATNPEQSRHETNADASHHQGGHNRGNVTEW